MIVAAGRVISGSGQPIDMRSVEEGPVVAVVALFLLGLSGLPQRAVSPTAVPQHQVVKWHRSN